MKKLRITSLIIATVLIVSLFTACGNSAPATTADSGTPSEAPASTTAPDSTEAPAEKIELTVGFWPEDTNAEEVARFEEYKATFESKYPNVELVPVAYNYAVDTFIPLAESGNLPVVYRPWFTEPQKLIKNGYARDVTDIINARGWDSAINPTVKDLLTSGGKLYGTPNEGYALGLMCNVDLFEQAGLGNGDGTIQFPKTWDELAQAAKTIKDKTGAAGLCLLAKDNAGGWHFSNIAWAFGADLCVANDDGTFTPMLNAPEAIAAMEYIKSLRWEYDVLTIEPTNEDWGTGFQQLGTGNAAMYIAANDAVVMPTQVNGLPVDKLSLIPIPAGPGGQYMLSGGTAYMFSPTATDAQVNAALDFIEVIGRSPEVSDVTLDGLTTEAKSRNEAGIPVIYPFPVFVNQDIIDAQNKIIDEFSNVNMALYNDYFNATKKAGVLRVETPGQTQDMYAELTKVLQAVITDKDADVTALMNTANSNYQALLDANK